MGQTIGRIRREGWGVMPYAMGRFQFVRRLYSAQSSVTRGKRRSETQETLFPDVSVKCAVQCIRDEAVYQPVFLPPDTVTGLRQIAETVRLEARSGETHYQFHYADVKNARLPSGDPVLMGHVLDVMQFPVARQVAEDPVALNVMSEYLGYTPGSWEINLFWSFASGASLEARRLAGQTTQFHFDVHSYNFAYAAYYLVDTTRENGAHVMVNGSHKDKPVAWLLGSANQTDEAVLDHYGADRIMTIEGNAGVGFWQDSSCYHKALPPEKSDRLLFQVRYF